MLINLYLIYDLIEKNDIKINGALHIGADECQELEFYKNLGLKEEDIIWIEANKDRVDLMKNRGYKGLYNATITDKDDNDVTFHISNNFQSSSVLELGTHLTEHPDVNFVNHVDQKSVTVDTFFNRNDIDSKKYNFWNIDIQGAELLALKGGSESLKNVDMIYLEVNEKHLYLDCPLIDEIDDYLSEYGFDRVITKMTNHGWGDALYIKDG